MLLLTRFTNYSRLLAAVCGALFFLPGLACAKTEGTDAAKTSAPIATTTIAGVLYDPSVPLAATETPLFDPKTPPTGARTFRIRYRGADNSVVPALLTVPGDGKGKVSRYPTVLLVHGLAGRKEDTILLAIALARQGYASFAIDLAGHGERGLPTGKSSFADLSLEEIHQIGGRSIADLRRGVDYLQTRSDIDTKKLGCVGISLGGILGGVFAGVEPRIACVALWSAGGDWGKLFTESQHPFAAQRRETTKLPDAATIETEFADVDPLRYAARIAPRPFLLLAGTEDTVVPNVCTDELYAAAQSPKSLKRYPGGHLPDLRAMAMETITFLNTNLNVNNPSNNPSKEQTNR